jgi:hypothetical protein
VKRFATFHKAQANGNFYLPKFLNNAFFFNHLKACRFPPLKPRMEGGLQGDTGAGFRSVWESVI